MLILEHALRVWRPGKLSEIECATDHSDFPLFVGALTPRLRSDCTLSIHGPNLGRQKMSKYIENTQNKIAVVHHSKNGICPTDPKANPVQRICNLDTVYLSRCKSVLSPFDWVVSCFGNLQVRFWPLNRDPTSRKIQVWEPTLNGTDLEV